MFKKIFPIVIIFVISWIAWLVLGGITGSRSNMSYGELRKKVYNLWGTNQIQLQPNVYWHKKVLRTNSKGKKYYETQWINIPLEKNDINVDIKYTPRKKGLLWYNLYGVHFKADYSFIYKGSQGKSGKIVFSFPQTRAVYDNFHFIVNGKEVEINVFSKDISKELILKPNEEIDFSIEYVSRGANNWIYNISNNGNVGRVKNFSLILKTNFLRYDFPETSLSPTMKKESEDSATLTWKFTSLLTGFNIGIAVPEKLNPGPWVAKVTYFAPISLFFFFLMIFILSILKNMKFHPMHYIFLAASFFSFHLLMAYLVDHIPLFLGFIISSVVSIFLVVSYLRIVVGTKFAFFEAGIAQFVYLIVFTFVHFFKGYTGLMVTIMSILTLFLIMQKTAKIEWDKAFKN